MHLYTARIPDCWYMCWSKAQLNTAHNIHILTPNNNIHYFTVYSHHAVCRLQFATHINQDGFNLQGMVRQESGPHSLLFEPAHSPPFCPHLFS